MRAPTLVAWCVLGLGLAWAGPGGAQEPEPAPAWLAEQRDLRIPMRDGQALAADLYLPSAPGRYPTVLIQTPYNKRGLGAPMVGFGRMEGLFDREHYAYVVVDWRGFFASRGAKTGPRVDRGQDGYDCVEWIATQSWSDGKVGTWGPSALGKVQFDTAMARPPHLVCCVPVIAAMGQQESFYFTGGALREAHVQSLDRLGFGVGAGVKQMRGRTLLWQMARRRTYRPEQIQVPMLLITGWWDHFPDEILQTFADLRARGGELTRAHSKLLIGPWDHMSVGQAKQGDWSFPAAAPENERSVRAFLDYWLRGVRDNGWADTPAVRYWRVNEEGWVSGDAWPAVSVASETWHVPAAGKLRAGEPPMRSGPQGPFPLHVDPDALPPTLGGANLPPLRHGPVDQSPLVGRTDVLVWDSEELPTPLRIVGSVRLEAACEAGRAGFDLAVRLCVVGPDGRSMLLGDSIARIAPGTEWNSVTVTLPATAATVPAGHRLRVILAGGNRPRFEANPEYRGPLDVRIDGGSVRLVLPVVAPK